MTFETFKKIFDNLKKFFFDENNQNIKEKLIKLMNLEKNKKIKRLNLDFHKI